MTARSPAFACGWDIIHACNYRCPYCFFIPSWSKEPDENNDRHLACSPEDWLVFWRRMGERYGEFQIEIAGGEPFYYPGFAALIAEVLREHRVRIVTNLSALVKPVVESWDPRRAALSASFHPHFSKEEEFLGKLGALRAAGFEVMASVVAYPEYFDRLPSLMKRFEAAGHPLYLNPFQGDYQGRTYPQGYEAAQSAFLHANAAASELEYRMREASPLGRSCAAGQKYFRAWPDGSLHRCCPARELGEAPLGHIRDENFALADAPAPCPAQKCFAPNEIVHLLPADSQLREESSVTSR